MGMFDTISCEMPGFLGSDQTKDFGCFMDDYVIREDGTLWHKTGIFRDEDSPDAEWLASEYTGSLEIGCCLFILSMGRVIHIFQEHDGGYRTVFSSEHADPTPEPSSPIDLEQL